VYSGIRWRLTALASAATSLLLYTLFWPAGL
jgi:hypothetical protein